MREEEERRQAQEVPKIHIKNPIPHMDKVDSSDEPYSSSSSSSCPSDSGFFVVTGVANADAGVADNAESPTE
jgi:hypothetical protein